MNYLYRIISVLFINIFLVQGSMSQDIFGKAEIGFSFGSGSQQVFPFSSKDYRYSTGNFKLIFTYPLKKGKTWLEMRIEPSVFSARHILLNKYFVQPEYGPDYLYLREVYTRRKTITEYALNLGLQLSFNPEGRFSWFITASTGPMFSDTATERLARGFAFSDIIGAGIRFRTEHMILEVKPGLRHVSNLDLQFPNSGHNSTTIDFGILFPVAHL